MTHVEIVCRDCGGPVVVVAAPDLETSVDIKVAYRWVCAECETVVGAVMDYGTLDLGIVRDSELRDRPL